MEPDRLLNSESPPNYPVSPKADVSIREVLRKHLWALQQIIFNVQNLSVANSMLYGWGESPSTQAI